MSSAAIKWAKIHLETLNQILVRQIVGTVERGGVTWNKCLEILEEHEAMLSEVGLDFRGVVGRGLREGDDGGVNGVNGVDGKVDSNGGDKNVGLGLS